MDPSYLPPRHTSGRRRTISLLLLPVPLLLLLLVSQPIIPLVQRVFSPHRCFADGDDTCQTGPTRYTFNHVTGECEPHKWCKGPEGFTFKWGCERQDCGQYTVETPPGSKCTWKPQSGPCFNSHPSYWYDETEQVCKKAIWSGCGGVRPFTTREECADQCEPVEEQIDPRCYMDKAKGPCHGSFKSYYYDPEVGHCRGFIWGGCEGSRPFESGPECRDLCVGKGIGVDDDGGTTTGGSSEGTGSSEGAGTSGDKQAEQEVCRIATSTHPRPGIALDENRCSMAPERGPCKALLPLFYYDAEEDRCKCKIWGGCGGVVPFDYGPDCVKTCRK